MLGERSLGRWTLFGAIDYLAPHEPDAFGEEDVALPFPALLEDFSELVAFLTGSVFLAGRAGGVLDESVPRCRRDVRCPLRCGLVRVAT